MLEKNLQKVIEALPYLNELLTEDYSFIVIDLVNMTNIAVQEDGIKLDKSVEFIVGGKTDDTYGIYEGIRNSKKHIEAVVPKGIFDKSVKMDIVPVFNDKGDAVAAINTIKGMEKEVTIGETTTSIYNSVSELSKGIEKIATTSQQLASFIKGISDFSANTQKRIVEIDDILSVIKNMASQSKLLALNASIEAARAGDAGKGFSVVAAEMSKLSNVSKESAEKVNNSLSGMKDAINTIAVQIEETSNNTETQSDATKQISATSQEILQVIKHLSDISKIDTFKEAFNK